MERRNGAEAGGVAAPVGTGGAGAGGRGERAVDAADGLVVVAAARGVEENARWKRAVEGRRGELGDREGMRGRSGEGNSEGEREGSGEGEEGEL